MIEIIEWLINMEKNAAQSYREAALNFSVDIKLSDFFSRLAEDEQLHEDMMRKAQRIYPEAPHKEPSITLDDITKTGIENSLHQFKLNLVAESPEKGAALNFLMKTEFSEWNDYFVLVVNTLKENNPEFAPLINGIKQHKNMILSYLELLPDGRQYIEQITRWPELSKTLLVVDDYSPIVEFMKAILSEYFNIVETAENGKEGLRKINEKYFDVIISDLDMPLMNGMELFKEAKKQDTTIENRFLFLTGGPAEDTLQFFGDNKLNFLTKPASVDEIHQAVNDIINKK